MNNINEKKIIIMDDHPLYQLGLKNILNESPEFSVLDCCRNTSELIFSLSIVKADIAIIALSQPEGDVNIKEVVEQLHENHPEMAIVALGENRHHQLLSMAMRPKIKSYFCKTLSAGNILSGLHHLQHDSLRDRSSLESGREGVMRELKKPKLQLSAREKFIIEYLHAGFTVSQVAQRVNRSVKTVSSQKRTAMRKLGITQNREIFQLNLSEI
jgi:two-component system, NarL family, captular synthesis response regulator RcsB